jgi:hypothetical protein
MKPMRTYTGTWLIVATVSLVAGCATQTAPTTQNTQPPKPAPIVQPEPGAASLPATGRVAIVAPNHAQVTDDQVRSYVMAHGVPRTVLASNVAIVSTRLVSSQQVRTLLHSARLNVSDQEPMWLVILSGKFVFSGPPGQTPTFPIGVEVFDAQTGNLMQYGGLPRAPRETVQ